jgi:hypothetical protein
MESVLYWRKRGKSSRSLRRVDRISAEIGRSRHVSGPIPLPTRQSAQQRVLAPVATIRFGVGQVLRAIEFDRHPCLRREQIDLHSTTPVERNRQLDVETKLSGGVGKRLQAPVEEGFSGTARALDTGRPRLEGAGGVHEQLAERRVHPVGLSHRPRTHSLAQAGL